MLIAVLVMPWRRLCERNVREVQDSLEPTGTRQINVPDKWPCYFLAAVASGNIEKSGLRVGVYSRVSRR
jgi:hypothetical protein